jgi:diacylglycerol O-acyltransferase / wax synthase
LRRYLLEQKALPDETLTAGLPVSIRPADDLNAGNAISFILSNLYTNEVDPLVRLKSIQRSTQKAKAQLQALPKEAINNYTIMLMSPMMVQLMTGMGGVTRPIFNTVISNVPGPSEDLYFAGCKLAEFYPISLIPHGQALNITVVSYSGQFNVSFTGDHDAMPSMQRLSVYSGEALQELELLLGIKRPVVTRRVSRKSH